MFNVRAVWYHGNIPLLIVVNSLKTSFYINKEIMSETLAFKRPIKTTIQAYISALFIVPP